MLRLYHGALGQSIVYSPSVSRPVCNAFIGGPYPISIRTSPTPDSSGFLYNGSYFILVYTEKLRV